MLVTFLVDKDLQKACLSGKTGFDITKENKKALFVWNLLGRIAGTERSELN